MADISACSGVREEKGKILLSQRCELRYQCKRYERHLDATVKKPSYIKAQFHNGQCYMKKEL